MVFHIDIFTLKLYKIASSQGEPQEDGSGNGNNVMEDLEKCNISLRQAVDLAADRVKWRHFVTSALATG